MYSEIKNLIVVYKEKDEAAINQLKKMVHTKDDDEENKKIIGTKDGAVNIISWSEKLWLDNKKAGTASNIDDRILFIGNIKGVEKLMPTLDIKFNKHGVSYGFSGKQAAIIIDAKPLLKKKNYDMFLADLKEVCDSTIVKEKRSIDFNDKKKNILNAVKAVGSLVLLGGAGIVAAVTATAFGDVKTTRNQQLFYGVINLYHNDLNSFMNN